MTKRPFSDEELSCALQVGQVPSLFGAPVPPKGVFENDEHDPAVVALMEVPVDLSLDCMQCITPFERLHSRLLALQEQAKQHPDYGAPRPCMDSIIPAETIPTFRSVEQEVFGSPDRPSPLLSLRPSGQALNNKALPKRDASTNVVANGKVCVKQEEEESLSPMEVVVEVEIYHPSRSSKQEVFKVLGSQTLLDVRRAIYCVTNCKVSERCQRSACFFINNVFYSDTSQEGCSDYSEVIKSFQWFPGAKDAATQSFPTLSMQDVTLNQLSIRPGERYFYVHAGGCSHYVIFSAIHLLHPKRDNARRSAYPDRIFCVKPRVRHCSVCDVRNAKKVTYNDQLCVESPTFFCDPCFYRLHYDKPAADGSMQALYTQFQVYKYWHE
eukprot:GGOE01022428.1.p1 GENE.GGOE01022428.1~~GGOE01022428.1.p1  ORF type:complete len:403 (+),score=139.63 GGOE01022428.1:64-1209(+)